MWSAKIFTLYPEFFPGILDIGLYKKARENKIWSLDIINIRDYALDKHGSVDDTPFGGGSGMVMRADVIDNCLDKNIKNSKNELIYLSPRGELLTQKVAKFLGTANLAPVPEKRNNPIKALPKKKAQERLKAAQAPKEAPAAAPAPAAEAAPAAEPAPVEAPKAEEKAPEAEAPKAN